MKQLKRFILGAVILLASFSVKSQTMINHGWTQQVGNNWELWIAIADDGNSHPNLYSNTTLTWKDMRGESHVIVDLLLGYEYTSAGAQMFHCVIQTNYWEPRPVEVFQPTESPVNSISFNP